MQQTTKASYSRTQKLLHWSMAFLLIAIFALHEFFVDAWREFERIGDTSGLNSFNGILHIWGGFALLALVLLRLWVRHRDGVPALPENEAPVLKFAAHLTHFGLYGIMFLMPVTGGIVYFGGPHLAEEVHEKLVPVMLLLFLLHVGGAVYQHFWLKTDVLRRIVDK
jgi:cytochrome b561